MSGGSFLARLQAESDRGFHKDLRAWVDEGSGVARVLLALDEQGQDVSPEEEEFLVEPLYDAYRLGVYQTEDYLPMWHELETKPTGTPEAQELLKRVRQIVDRTRSPEGEGDGADRG